MSERRCIPTKTLLYSAKTYDNACHASKYAVSVSEVSFDLSKIIARKQKIVRKLVLGVKGKLTAGNVTIVTGEASVIDKNHVLCGDETYECDNLLLCTVRNIYSAHSRSGYGALLDASRCVGQ